MSWFDPIKTELENVIADLHGIFAPGGGGFTEANFVKLGADIVTGVQVDITQVEIGIKAVATGVAQAIPIAQQAIADAQLVAVAYPAVEPFIAEMQLGLSAVQALSTVLATSPAPTAPQTIPQGIVALSDLAKSVGQWAGQVIQAVKSA